MASALAALGPGLSGVKIDTEIFRPATFIEIGTRNLTWAAVIGFLLLGLVLGVFHYEWRRVIISGVVILLSLAAAVFVLYLRGITLNAMILAGFVVALGVVIDDAVVDVHNIVRRLRERRRNGSATPAARVLLEAALETRGGVLAATTVVLLAVLPVLALEGPSGALFGSLVGGFVLAVLASMAVALVVTPALATFLFGEAPLGGGESPERAGLRPGYDWLLSQSVHTPRPAYLMVVVLVGIGIAVLPRVWPDSLLPTFKEYDFVIRWDGAAGTSHTAMARVFCVMWPVAQSYWAPSSSPGARPATISGWSAPAP